MEARTFTVTGVTTPKGIAKKRGCLGGIFKSKTPMSAAKKASRRICRVCNMEGNCTLIVRIRETTADSHHKDYVYKIKRTMKDTKVTKTTTDKKKVKIVFKFVTKATSLNQFDKI